MYFMLEVVWKTITKHPERISWTMLVLAVILSIPLERCGAELPWDCPLWMQAFVCAVAITATEFVSGVVLNLWLELNIWDYSDLKYSIMGQVCIQFSILWYFLSFLFIPVFDWLRWSVVGGEKPHYRMTFSKKEVVSL